MESEITFKINNVGPVANANIKIGKINVVGGKNSTGKSTSSKLLYCFLRSNSSDRQDLAMESLYSEIRRLRMILGRYLSDESLDSIRMYQREIDVHELNDLVEFYEMLKFSFFETYEIDAKTFEESLWHEADRNRGKPLLESDRKLRDYKLIFRQINIIDQLIPILESNSNELYESTMETLLHSEFSSNPIYRLGRFQSSGFSSISSEDLEFEYSIDFSDKLYKYKGVFGIEDVYYLDSFSLFDILGFRPAPLNRSGTPDHTTRLLRSIRDNSESENIFDKIINEEIIKIESLINDLIGGSIWFERNQAVFKLNNYNKNLSMANTASGVKQIGILQLLLANRKLKPDSFLIIDEPEVNLHPEWQVKFAGILILLAKHLDITLYINTHSPLFIQAIDAYSEYYDLNDDTNYYLTEKTDVEGKYDINKIENDELFRIYDNLGKPYDFIDIIKIQNAYKDKEE